MARICWPHSPPTRAIWGSVNWQSEPSHCLPSVCHNCGMLLQDVAGPESKFFLKSEWGPASDDWPAVSFSKQSVGRRMRGIYDPARDFVIYVGTTNPVNTPDPAHRSRLLSLVSMVRIPLMWALDSGDVGRASERSDAGWFLQ
jgi:hypothetical protein